MNSPDLRELLGDRYKATIQTALLADKPGLIEDAKRIGGQLGQLMYLTNVDRMHRTLTAILPNLLAQAWDEGAAAAWERSTVAVNAERYCWRSAGEPLNPYRQEADRGVGTC